MPKTDKRVSETLKTGFMTNLHQASFVDQLETPKQLIKPVKIEEMIQNEKAVEALCESRNSCVLGSNSGIGSDDEILF